MNNFLRDIKRLDIIDKMSLDKILDDSILVISEKQYKALNEYFQNDSKYVFIKSGNLYYATSLMNIYTLLLPNSTKESVVYDFSKLRKKK